MSSWQGSDLISKKGKGVEPIYQDGFPPKGYFSHPTDPRPTFAWTVEETQEGGEGVYAYFPTKELAEKFKRQLLSPKEVNLVSYNPIVARKEIDDGKFWVKISKKRIKVGRSWKNDYQVDVIKDYEEVKQTVEDENKDVKDLNKIIYGELINKNWQENPFYQAQIGTTKPNENSEAERIISNPIHFDSINGAHHLIPRPKYNGFKEEGGPFIHYNKGFSNDEVKIFTAFDYNDEHIDSFEESLSEGNISAGELFENGYSDIKDELGEKTGQRLVFTIPQLFKGKWSKMAAYLDRRGNGEQVIDSIGLEKANVMVNNNSTASPNKRFGDYIEDMVGSGWQIERTPEFAKENNLLLEERGVEQLKLIQRLGGVGERSYPPILSKEIENPPSRFVDLGYGKFRLPDIGELTDIAFPQRANPDVNSNALNTSLSRRDKNYIENLYRISRRAGDVVLPDIRDWSMAKGNQSWLVDGLSYNTYPFISNLRAASVSNQYSPVVDPLRKSNHYVRKIGGDYYSNTKGQVIWADKLSAQRAANWNRRNNVNTRTIKVKNGYANIAKIPDEIIEAIKNNRNAVEYEIMNGKSKGQFGNTITDYLKGTKSSQRAETFGGGSKAIERASTQYKENINKIIDSNRTYFREKYLATLRGE